MAARRTRTSPVHDRRRQAASSITLPGILLGLGVGGLVDGILLHQVLQWHHMRTGDGTGGGEPFTTVAGLEANTLADGFFHVATLILTLVGLFLLWRRAGANGRRHPPTELLGLLLAGWGLFNIVEGTVNHLILEIHHVRDDLGGPLGWDLGFLAFGAALIVAGWLLARRSQRRHGATS